MFMSVNNLHIIRLPIVLTVKCNLQKGDSIIASKDILLFVPCNRKIFVGSKLCYHAKIGHLDIKAIITVNNYMKVNSWRKHFILVAKRCTNESKIQD